MSTPDQKNPANKLGETLEELESLLESNENDTPAKKIEIPVLDELVTEADFVESQDENNIEQIEEQIIDLADKLESKFSGELDQLVTLLKDNLKNSIVEELRSQANLNQDELAGQDSLNMDSPIDPDKPR